MRRALVALWVVLSWALSFAACNNAINTGAGMCGLVSARGIQPFSGWPFVAAGLTLFFGFSGWALIFLAARRAFADRRPRLGVSAVSMGPAEKVP